jgi:hypothetical protein
VLTTSKILEEEGFLSLGFHPLKLHLKGLPKKNTVSIGSL